MSYQVTAVKSSLCRQIYLLSVAPQQNSGHVAPCCVPSFQVFSNFNYESVFLSHHRNTIKTFILIIYIVLMLNSCLIKSVETGLLKYIVHIPILMKFYFMLGLRDCKIMQLLNQIILTGCVITDLFLFPWFDSNMLLYIVMFFKPFFWCIRQRCTT